jgi:hypothetical protein
LGSGSTHEGAVKVTSESPRTAIVELLHVGDATTNRCQRRRELALIGDSAQCVNGAADRVRRLRESEGVPDRFTMSPVTSWRELHELITSFDFGGTDYGDVS